MCKYCTGEYEKVRVEYTTKAARRAHGGSWFGEERRLVVRDFPGTDIKIIGSVMHVPIETEYDGRMMDISKYVQINFCPFCGKKLNAKEG